MDGSRMNEQAIVAVVEDLACGPIKLSAVAGEGNVAVYATVPGEHGELESILYADDYASEDEVLKEVWDVVVAALAGCFRYKNQEVVLGPAPRAEL